jgi:ribosome-associated protein
LEEKKGEDILLIDVVDVASFADYFVFCTGTSNRMLDALAKEIKDEVKQEFHIITQPEGNADSGWVVLDLGDVVCHLFSPEQREYYQLEELWQTGKVLLRLQ